MQQFREFIKRLLSGLINMFESPWGAALTSGFVYLVISAYYGNLYNPSKFPYYNYLADAFLHGQTWLRLLPPTTHDLSIFNGNYYLYWSPFPAILLMPFVAVFGVELNDVFYTILIASLNIGLVSQLLRAACHAELFRITKTQRAILVFFFAFGTVHFTIAPYGKVWMTGQLIGLTCVLLSYLAAFTLKGGKAWFFSCLALAGAMLTRNHMVFTGIFPISYLLLKEKPWNWLNLLRNIALGFLPLSIALAFYLIYNFLRFGNPFDNGVNYHMMHVFFHADFEQYGLFNLHYVPRNLYYQYIFYPLPITQESMMGGSLFLLSPVFIGIFSALKKSRSVYYVSALFFSILFTNVPILLLMGTGWMHFGPRYSLDFAVPLLLLTAIGIQKWKTIILLILTFISAIHYFIGVIVIRSI